MADRSINDIPPQVKELSNIHDSSDTEEMEDGILSHLNPNPNPIPEPCEASTRIKVTEDLTLIFVPRIKLNIMIICQDDVIPMIMDEDTFISIVTIRFRDTKFFRKEISLPSEDIHMHVLLPPKRAGGNLEAVAEGNLKSRELLMKLQKKLLQKLGTFEVNYCGSVYEIRVLPPAFSEDPNEMMAYVSGITQDPPTILLKGIPSQWFAEQPDSSKASKRLLRIFLETFGEVRYLDTSEHDADAKYCNVAIQYANYEDCRKALNQL